MKDERAWLIEASGPCYLRALGLGEKPGNVSVDQSLEWTADASKAIRFARSEDAERVLFAFRKFRHDLFPTCFPHFPRPVEHMWMAKGADRDAS